MNIHLGAYLAMAAVVLIVWAAVAATTSASYFWPIWPILGGAIGLFSHAKPLAFTTINRSSDVTNAWAVVPGSSGLGAIFAEQLAERGLSLVLTGRDEARLSAVALQVAARRTSTSNWSSATSAPTPESPT